MRVAHQILPDTSKWQTTTHQTDKQQMCNDVTSGPSGQSKVNFWSTWKYNIYHKFIEVATFHHKKLTSAPRMGTDEFSSNESVTRLTPRNVTTLYQQCCFGTTIQHGHGTAIQHGHGTAIQREQETRLSLVAEKRYVYRTNTDASKWRSNTNNQHLDFSAPMLLMRFWKLHWCRFQHLQIVTLM